jgi:hypothetical protein
MSTLNIFAIHSAVGNNGNAEGIHMRTHSVFMALPLVLTATLAMAQSMQWDEESCRQVMLGYKDGAEVSQKVAEYREKIKAGDILLEKVIRLITMLTFST